MKYIFKAILEAFAGKNIETRPEIAFNKFMTRLCITDNLNKWHYILKYLIILDRCVEEKYFLFDIAELNLSHIESFKDEDGKNSN